MFSGYLLIRLHGIGFEDEASDVLDFFEVLVVNAGLLIIVLVFIVGKVGSLAHILHIDALYFLQLLQIVLGLFFPPFKIDIIEFELFLLCLPPKQLSIGSKFGQRLLDAAFHVRESLGVQFFVDYACYQLRGHHILGLFPDQILHNVSALVFGGSYPMVAGLLVEVRSIG